VTKPAETKVLPKRARTRKKLLTAARDLVYTKGIENVAIVDITRAAGVAAGSFYNYFPNKGAIVAAIIEDFELVFSEHLEAHRLRLKDPAMRLSVTLKYYFKQSQENEAWRSFIINAGLSDQRVLVQPSQQCFEDVSIGMRGGRFKSDSAAITVSLITGMATHVGLEIQRGNLPRSAVTETVRHVLRMLGLPDIAAKAFADAPIPEIPFPTRSDLPADPMIPFRIAVERRAKPRDGSAVTAAS
jgi:AcrR family transcriptional regulator